MQSGASATLIVGGVENFLPSLSVRERVTVIRDQTLVSTSVSLVADAACPGSSDVQGVASTDHSINDVPLNSGPDYTYTRR